MSDVSAWSPLDESNTAPPPDGWPEFMLPSAVNNTGRMMMGAVRRLYDKQVDGTLVLPYLKLSGGGTVTGNVGVSGTLTAGAVSATTIYASSNINTGGTLTATGNATISGSLSAATTISAGGNVWAAGYIIGPNALATKAGGQISLYDGSGTQAIALANTGDNYYLNDRHFFRNRANAVTFAAIDSAGLSASAVTCNSFNATGTLTVGGAANVTGAVVSSRADGLALYAPNGGLTVGLDVSCRHLTASGTVTGSTVTGSTVTGSAYTGSSMNLSGEVRGGSLATGGAASVGGVVTAHDVMPSVDNVSICGGASSAWNIVESYNFITKSDATLKEDIGPLPDTLALVAAVAPQAFQYVGDDKRHWGFLAQDVRAAVSSYPVDLVSGDEGRLGLDYGGLTAMLWKAVQELEQRLTAGGL